MYDRSLVNNIAQINNDCVPLSMTSPQGKKHDIPIMSKNCNSTSQLHQVVTGLGPHGLQRGYRGSTPDSRSSSRSHSRSHSQSPRSRSPRSRSPCSARSRSPGSPQSQTSVVSKQSRLSRNTAKTSRSRSESPEELSRLPHNCVSPPVYPRNFPLGVAVDPQRTYPDVRYAH